MAAYMYPEDNKTISSSDSNNETGLGYDDVGMPPLKLMILSIK